MLWLKLERRMIRAQYAIGYWLGYHVVGHLALVFPAVARWLEDDQ